MTKTFSSTFAIAAVVFALGGCAGTGKQESVGEFIDDAAITAKVKSAFVEDKEVSALNVKVETYKGVVQLSGFVSGARESWRASQLARNVQGVKSVRNDLQVK